MTLKDQLRTDATTALKARDELTLSSLRSVIGAVESAEKAGKTAVVFDDQAVLKVIKTQIKQRKESAEAYVIGGRPESAERELAEAAILAVYVPTELTDTELEAIVIEVVRRFTEPTAQDFGAIMKSVVAAADGRADGKRISTLVRTVIG